MLTAIEIGLERLAKTLPPDNEDARKYLTQTQELIEHSLVDLRRIITALRPGVLDQLGLAPALEWLGNHTLRPLGIAVTVENEAIRGRLPGEIEIILFRIAQEAISNIARHSQAKQVTVCLRHTQDQVTLTLTDNGCGFDTILAVPTPNHGKGLGLASMRERALLAGGQIAIISTPAMGTVIQVIIPLPAAIDGTHFSNDKLLGLQKQKINGNQPHEIVNEQML
jgi:signal transduction histidine kinase